MKRLLKLLSGLGLGLTLIPSCLVFIQILDWNSYLNLMAAGTLLWFATAPFWMKKES